MSHKNQDRVILQHDLKVQNVCKGNERNQWGFSEKRGPEASAQWFVTTTSCKWVTAFLLKVHAIVDIIWGTVQLSKEKDRKDRSESSSDPHHRLLYQQAKTREDIIPTGPRWNCSKAHPFFILLSVYLNLEDKLTTSHRRNLKVMASARQINSHSFFDDMIKLLLLVFQAKEIRINEVKLM